MKRSEGIVIAKILKKLGRIYRQSLLVTEKQIPLKFPVVLKLDFSKFYRRSDLEFVALQYEVEQFMGHLKKRKLTNIIEKSSVKTKRYGEQTLPTEIVFHQLRHIIAFLDQNKQHNRYEKRIEELTKVLSGITRWPSTNGELKILMDTKEQIWQTALSALSQLLGVTDLKGTSNYSRKLLTGDIPTKFLETNEHLIKTLYLAGLPEQMRRESCKNSLTELFSLTTFNTLFRIRFLDSNLQEKSGVDFNDFALNLGDFEHFLEKLHTNSINFKLYIIENKTTYFTFPTVENGICLFGEGFKAWKFETLNWSPGLKVVYWGDLDATGLEILDGLRKRIPKLCSFLMDDTTINQFSHLASLSKKMVTKELPWLSEKERRAYNIILEEGLMLEQEKIPLDYVETALSASH